MAKCTVTMMETLLKQNNLLHINKAIRRISCSAASSNLQLKTQGPLHNHNTMHYSTRTSKAAIKAYHKHGLSAFVFNLSETEREELLVKLTKASEATKLPEDELNQAIPAPSTQQLRYVALFSGIPFIGFGLLDNTIMLTAGEYIDITFGAWLGITTMAAAAIGNMVSDVLGITTAGFVEQAAVKMGLSTPTITLEQMSLRSTRSYANLGRCVGVIIGCILGMWPLLLISNKEKEKESDFESADNQKS